MKKLFALLLTLALVFAVASPAMAASWGSDGSVPATATPYAVSVTLLQAIGTTAPSGEVYYNEYPSNLGVVAGTPVRFVVTFTVPHEVELKAYYGVSTLPAGDQKATVVVSNINLDYTAAVDKSGIVAGIDTADDTITLNQAKLVYGATYSATFTGTVKTTATAKVTASIGYIGKMVESGIVKTYGSVAYTITTNGISAGNAGTSSYRALRFTGTPVSGWKLIVGTDAYIIASGPVFVRESDNYIVDYTNTNYTALLAAYNELTGVLGFKYGDRVYYTETNILAFFGFSNSVSATKEYKPYNTSLIVTDPVANVPNTGDSASFAGFALTGLALLAAAAVVVKKVRA